MSMCSLYLQLTHAMKSVVADLVLDY